MAEAGFDLSRSQADVVALIRSGAVAVNVVRLPARSSTEQDIAARFTEACRRFEILRTVFRTSSGATSTYQIVLDDFPAPAAGADGLDLAAGPLVGYALEDGTLRVWASAAVADHRSLRFLGTVLLGEASAGEDPIQFADFAGWEAEQRADDTPQSRLAAGFWGDVPAAVATSGGAWTAAPVTLGAPVDTASWLAGWLTVARRNRLGWLDPDAEPVVRVVVAGRPIADVADAIGPFARAVDVRLGVSGSDTFDAVRASVTDVLGQAELYCTFAPTAQSRLGFREVPAEADPPGASPDVDVELVVFGDGRSDRGLVHVRADVGDARRVAGHLGTVLAASSADPSIAIAHLPMLSEEERERLRVLGTGAELVEDPGDTVLSRFLRTSSRTPDATAVTDAATRLTYAELADRSASVAAGLLTRGVSAPVAIAVDRSVDTVVAMLAVWRCGLPFQPFDRTLPPGRVIEQLELAGSELVLLPGTGSLELDGHECVSAASLMDPGRDGGGTGAPHFDAPAGDGQLAYLMSTSGSTGVPKVVQVTHRNLAGYSLGVAQELGFSGDSRFGVVTGLNTDLAYTMLMPALALGSAVRLLDDEEISDLSLLAERVGQERISVLKTTPSHLRALLAGGGELPVATLLLGGEALESSLVHAARSAGVERVVNHYGPTETTVGALVHVVADRVPDGPVPIGHPLPGVHLQLIDEAGELVPDGVAGELAIGGVGVSAGYRGDPRSTENRFRSAANPGDGSRFYLTGDVARRNEDGDVVFLGRRDGQVKVRGHRVELGEVESRLRAVPGVVDAAVLVDTTDDEGDRLIAYVVGDTTATDPDSLTAALEARLPSYMLPAHYVRLPEMPRLTNGKLDRTALPDPRDAAQPHVRAEAAATDTEAALLKIWVDILGTDRVGVTDDFFRAGGHSLLATRIMARARSEFGLPLPLHLIFMYPTVRTMSAEIDQRAADAKASAGAAADELRDMVAQLSDVEVEALLAREFGRSEE